MKGRDPMKGRHSVGVQRVDSGKTRSGQSEPASNKFKTASSTFMKPKAPVMANQAKTSVDLQNRLKGKGTQPFTNTGGAATLPAQSGAAGAKPGLEPRIKAGLSGNRAPANPPGTPLGQGKMPNQRFQIGGRTSVASTPRKAGDNGSGYPAKRNRSFYGQ